MDSDVYLCFGCGTKNRVPENADRTRARCAKCKEALFPETVSARSTTASRESKNDSMHTPDRQLSTKNRKRNVVAIGLVVISIVIGNIVMQNWSVNDASLSSPILVNSSTQLSPPPKFTKVQPSLPPEVFQKAGIVWNNTGDSGSHPFEIVTSTGADYFIKLVDSLTGADKVAVFVKGGQRLEVKVPAGTYSVRYASGETWRGEEHLFGPDDMTDYQASSVVFDFNSNGDYYLGYTIELIRQADGNMQTRSILASSF